MTERLLLLLQREASNVTERGEQDGGNIAVTPWRARRQRSSMRQYVHLLTDRGQPGGRTRLSMTTDHAPAIYVNDQQVQIAAAAAFSCSAHAVTVTFTVVKVELSAIWICERCRLCWRYATSPQNPDVWCALIKVLDWQGLLRCKSLFPFRALSDDPHPLGGRLS